VGPEDPIAVVIAKDGDAFASPDGAKYTIRRFFHRWNRKRIWEMIPRRLLKEGFHVFESTGHQHVGNGLA
jgi:hypothetical protein